MSMQGANEMAGRDGQAVTRVAATTVEQGVDFSAYADAPGRGTGAEMLAGGTVRVSAAAPAQPPMRTGGAPRGADGVRAVEVARYVAGRDDAAPQSVMQSLRIDGPFRTVELEPGNPTSRTRVEVAERLGLIRSAGPGLWADMAAPGAVQAAPASPAPVGTPAEPEVASEAAEDPGAGVFDAEADQLWAEDIAGLDQPVYDSAVARTTAAVVSGEGLDGVALQLAKDTGMAPELAQQYVSEGAAYYADVVAADLERQGIAPDQLEAFYGHLRAVRGPEMRHAIQRLTLARDVSVFRTLATEWQMLQARRG